MPAARAAQYECEIKKKWGEGVEMYCICIDSQTQGELERRYSHMDLKAFFDHPRVRFVQFDLRLLTVRDVGVWCRSTFPEATPSDIVGIQASFVCTTLTKAGDCKEPRHRGENGTPLTIQAQFDDTALNVGLEVLRWVSEEAPECLITAENGWHSHFKDHMLVQETLEKGNWQIIKTELCAAANQELDRGANRQEIYPKKSTCMLVKWPEEVKHMKQEEQILPRCAGEQCPMTLADGRRHQVVVCSRKRESEIQPGMSGEQNKAKISSILPIGLFEKVWAGTERKQPTKMGDCIVCGERGATSACTNRLCQRWQHGTCLYVPPQI